ncbi:MAG: glycosyltransferase [Candidatus Stahlbacteria bacterium]|nr:glycosyltransferase [Candidatus Stahlbacteria bacterium]
MKILNINSYYFIRGGADRYFFELSELLSRHYNHVIPFCTEHSENYFTPYSSNFTECYDIMENGVKHIEKYVKNIIRMFYHKKSEYLMHKIIQSENPDIAHVHNIYHRIPFSIFKVLTQYNIPIVYTLHDYKLICPGHLLYTKGNACERCKLGHYYNAIFYKCQNASFFRSFLVMILAYYCKKAGIFDLIDCIVAPSKFAKNKVIGFGFSENKIVHIPHFIESEKYLPEFHPGVYALYIGRIEKNKGVETLIKAFKSINFPLKIAGNGHLKSFLEKFCIKEGINNVEFVGSVSFEQAKELYCGALCTIVPSEWYEVFGLTILESFACGKPVIASRIGGIPEIVEDEYNGFLFNPKDVQGLIEKLNILITNRKRAEEMGKNAYYVAKKHYSSNKHYESIRSLYASLLWRKGSLN